MDGDTLPGNIKYDYTQRVTQFGAGLSLGSQVRIDGRIYIDLYIGGVFNTMNLVEERQYKNPGANDSGYAKKFYTGAKDFSDIYMIGGLRVGMAF